MEFGDTLLWVVVSLVLIGLLWLKFIENYMPLWGVWIAWIPLAGFLTSRYLKYRKKMRARKPWQK